MWRGFDPQTYFVTKCLKNEYEIEIVKDEPDLLVYSVFNDEHKNYNCLKLFITGENTYPNFNECDYAIASLRMSVPGRYLFVPHSVNFHSGEKFNLIKEPVAPHELQKKRFCLFLYSNATRGVGAVMRARFCEKLMNYKRVDCPGKVLHNMNIPELSARNDSSWHKSKNDLISRYKFIIAFENTDGNGYMTEKIIDAYINNVVPIYWGSTADCSLFPRDSMIYAADYSTLDELVERVKEVDSNDDLYMSMLAANPLRNPEFRAEWLGYTAKRTLFIKKIAEKAFSKYLPFETRESIMSATASESLSSDFILPQPLVHLS